MSSEPLKYKYVYPRGTKFRGVCYMDSKLHYAGIFDTPELAKYEALKMKNGGHHWEGMPKDISEYFGFTYLITNTLNGRLYVGKKQFYRWVGPQGGYKCTDPRLPHWDPKAWAENDWHLYVGSSDELSSDVQKYGQEYFRYEVLDLCFNKLDLHLSELHNMINRNVLEELDTEGNYLYYNKNIASLEFRAPFKHSAVDSARELSEEAMRKYYLRPSHCPVCNAVVPYGFPKCTVCP